MNLPNVAQDMELTKSCAMREQVGGTPTSFYNGLGHTTEGLNKDMQDGTRAHTTHF